jgi:DNA-binding NarL/FixJ family response regulator
MEPIKIMVVDDHKIVRDGIRALLIGQKTIKYIGDAEDAESLFNFLLKTQPDVLILDIILPGKSGVEITVSIKEKYPCIRILILSSNSDEETILSAVKAGANGFLSKDTSKEELITAIMAVATNEGYFGEKINKIIYKSYIEQVTSQNGKPANCLSDREVEILTLLADGFTNKEIADKLFISPRTIDTHKANIMAKLNLSSTVELVKYAIRKGYIKL